MSEKWAPLGRLTLDWIWRPHAPPVLITDSGKTEFHGVPTRTCLAIGPDEAAKIDPVTGALQLL